MNAHVGGVAGGVAGAGGGAGGDGGVGGGGGIGGGGGMSAPTPRRVLCLRLVKTAIAAAGSALGMHPPLLDMVRDDLCFALLQLVQGRCVVCGLCT